MSTDNQDPMPPKEQMAKSIATLPSEALSVVGVLAKIIHVHDGLTSSEAYFQLAQVRPDYAHTTDALINELVELGVIESVNDAFKSTSEFNQLVSKHQPVFQDNLKGDAGPTDPGPFVRSAHHKLKLRTYIDRWVMLMHNAESVPTKNWSTQDHVNYLAFKELEIEYRSEVNIFNAVAVGFRDNPIPHGALVEMVAYAFKAFYSKGLVRHTNLGEAGWRLEDDVPALIEDIKSRLKPVVKPFEVTFHVNGMAMSAEDVKKLIDFLVVFSKACFNDDDFVSIHGIRFDRTKTTEFLKTIGEFPLLASYLAPRDFLPENL